MLLRIHTSPPGLEGGMWKYMDYPAASLLTTIFFHKINSLQDKLDPSGLPPPY